MDDDITSAALRLLAGLVGEMAAANLEGLVMDSNIIHLLIQKMQDSSPKLRRASFDLFFELTKSCFDDVIRPHLGKPLSCCTVFSMYSQCILNGY